MLKKVMDKLRKGDKGFTLVELIVVIVILLILAGAIVPNVMKYAENAKQANCKSNAASILTELQADYIADQGGIGEHGTTGITGDDLTYTIQNVTVTKVTTLTGDSNPATAEFTVGGTYNGEITGFEYDSDGYTATWEQGKGWSVVETKQQ